MSTETKISRLKEALLTGEHFTPLKAFYRFGMAQNTFNREIWELRHKHKLPLSKRTIVENGAKFKEHWLER